MGWRLVTCLPGWSTNSSTGRTSLSAAAVADDAADDDAAAAAAGAEPGFSTI